MGVMGAGPVRARDGAPRARAGWVFPACLLVLLGGALALRLSGLGSAPLWADEVATWVLAGLPGRSFSGPLAPVTPSPPAYQLLVAPSGPRGTDRGDASPARGGRGRSRRGAAGARGAGGLRCPGRADRSCPPRRLRLPDRLRAAGARPCAAVPGGVDRALAARALLRRRRGARRGLRPPSASRSPAWSRCTPMPPGWSRRQRCSSMPSWCWRETSLGPGRSRDDPTLRLLAFAGLVVALGGA
jgi:hypothetical protein